MCKYCSELGTGDCNEFIFEAKYPIKIGDAVFSEVCIDTLIIENDHNRDDYDVKKHGIVLQTTLGTEDGRHINRSIEKIKFCPFCGANLEKVYCTNA